MCYVTNLDHNADTCAAIHPETSLMDKRIFWWGLWLSPAVWGVFGFIGLLKLHFEWFIVVSVALMLNATRVYGYTN